MNYYNSIAVGYNELYGEEQRIKINKVIKEIGSMGKILDVGCGTGVYASLFSNYTGVDISKKMIEIAKKQKGTFLVANAEYLPFEDKSFDKVICISAIHNVSNPKKAIDEMKRVSKGVLAITIIKKSKYVQTIKGLLGGFKERDIGKDILFIKR